MFSQCPLTSSAFRGGEEVLLDVGGQDATEAFEDVGHSDEAREILEGLLVGTLKRKVWAYFFSFPSSLPDPFDIPQRGWSGAQPTPAIPSRLRIGMPGLADACLPSVEICLF